ncbi:unnamed protein product, partial [Brassica napus]
GRGLFRVSRVLINGIEGETQKAETEKKGGRGRKRKAATQATSMKARKDVTAMISRSKEGHESANSDLREEERVMKEQSEIHGNPSTPP